MVATCALGLEEFLERELRALEMQRILCEKGAVRFAGTWKDVWRANLWLRTANRVLIEVGSFPAPDGDALYAGMRRLIDRKEQIPGLSSEALFDPNATLAVRATASNSNLRDTRWIGQRTKDAVVDAQRDRFGRRSSVDRREPDRMLRVLVRQNRGTLLLDTSREPLDRRGYRMSMVDAPVREQLAAACVMASGWNGEGPVLDPMCGSGTLLAEAASWALGWAPGRLREKWAFADLPTFDPRAFDQMQRAAGPRTEQNELLRGAHGPMIFGGDEVEAAVRATQDNLHRAGFLGMAHLKRRDAFNWEPPAEQGLLLVNPPYGERLVRQEDLWKQLGDWMKQRFAGWTAVVLAGDLEAAKTIGLKPQRRIPVRHGQLDARILIFDLY